METVIESFMVSAKLPNFSNESETQYFMIIRYQFTWIQYRNGCHWSYGIVRIIKSWKFESHKLVSKVPIWSSKLNEGWHYVCGKSCNHCTTFWPVKRRRKKKKKPRGGRKGPIQLATPTYITVTYTARFSLHQVHGSQCTKEYYTKYSWRPLADVCMVSEVLCVVRRCPVLLLIPLSGLGCALLVESDKVPSIVPYPGVLHWPLAVVC